MSYRKLTPGEKSFVEKVTADLQQEYGEKLFTYFANGMPEYTLFDVEKKLLEEPTNAINQILFDSFFQEQIMKPLFFDINSRGSGAIVIKGRERPIPFYLENSLITQTAGNVVRAEGDLLVNKRNGIPLSRIREIYTPGKAVISFQLKEEGEFKEIQDQATRAQVFPNIGNVESVTFNDSTLMPIEYFINPISKEGAPATIFSVTDEIKRYALMVFALVNENDVNKTFLFLTRKGQGGGIDKRKKVADEIDKMLSQPGAVILDSKKYRLRNDDQGRIPFFWERSDPKHAIYTTAIDWIRNRLDQRLGFGQNFQKSGTFQANNQEISAMMGDTLRLDMMRSIFQRRFISLGKKIIEYSQSQLTGEWKTVFNDVDKNAGIEFNFRLGSLVFDKLKNNEQPKQEPIEEEPSITNEEGGEANGDTR